MDEITYLGVAGLLDHFRDWQEEKRAGQYQALTIGLTRMQTGLAILWRFAEKEEPLHATQFNIFSMLGAQNDEVNTHSRMIYELLLPNGVHSQGGLFLETFLRMVAERDLEFQLPEFPLTGKNWQVERERHIDFGIIDIVLSSRDAGYLVSIENKVWANESENQLGRYSMWMENQRADHPQQVLIYLTRGGWDSDTANQAKYLALSYHYDIVYWLEGCIPKIQAPRVVETIRQYLDIIRNF